MSYADNNKVTFDYEILDKFESGLVLFGFEVKAIKAGKVSIKGAYVKIVLGKLQLIGAIVSPYQPNNTPNNYDQQRTRDLLIKKHQLKKLIGKIEQQSIALVPLKLYNKNGKIKLEVGIAKGKKKHDKREKIKKREFNIQKRRLLKDS